MANSQRGAGGVQARPPGSRHVDLMRREDRREDRHGARVRSRAPGAGLQGAKQLATCRSAPRHRTRRAKSRVPCRAAPRGRAMRAPARALCVALLPLHDLHPPPPPSGPLLRFRLFPRSRGDEREGRRRGHNARRTHAAAKLPQGERGRRRRGSRGRTGKSQGNACTHAVARCTDPPSSRP